MFMARFVSDEIEACIEGPQQPRRNSTLRHQCARDNYSMNLLQRNRKNHMAEEENRHSNYKSHNVQWTT